MADSQLIMTVSLSASEDLLPPVGIPPDPSLGKGFATVLLTLENQEASQKNITLQAIEILSDPGQQPQPFAFEPRTIELKPLEHALIDIHLINPSGFCTQHRVKAIVRYCIGHHPPATVVSQPVVIVRR